MIIRIWERGSTSFRRGGSWFLNFAQGCSAAYRSRSITTALRYDNLGFRLVRRFR